MSKFINLPRFDREKPGIMDEIMLLGEKPLPLVTLEITQEDEGENFFSKPDLCNSISIDLFAFGEHPLVRL
jgi:hypothetical protein